MESDGYFPFDPRAPYIIKKQPVPEPTPEPTPEPAPEPTPEPAPEPETAPETETPENPV